MQVALFRLGVQTELKTYRIPIRFGKWLKSYFDVCVCVCAVILQLLMARGIFQIHQLPNSNMSILSIGCSIDYSRFWKQASHLP